LSIRTRRDWLPPVTATTGSTRIVELLAGTSVFGGVAPELLSRVADLATERSFRKGQFVFQQGDVGDACYVIDSGAVKVFTTSEEGTEVIYCTLGVGDCFGELSFFDGLERSAAVETLAASRLVVLRRPALDLLLDTDASASRALLAYQGSIIRRLTEQAGDLVVLDLPGRLAKCLDRLATSCGLTTPEGIRIDLSLTQSDLAGLVGASRPSVNQALQAFVRRGVLRADGRSILITDLPALRRRFGQ
jgi:CRP/FNR family transcriptional regulator, cyclic AMP receptor protein